MRIGATLSSPIDSRAPQDQVIDGRNAAALTDCAAAARLKKS